MPKTTAHAVSTHDQTPETTKASKQKNSTPVAKDSSAVPSTPTPEVSAPSENQTDTPDSPETTAPVEEGRAADVRNSEVPTDKPVAQVESAATGDAIADAEAEGQQPIDDSGMAEWQSPTEFDAAAREKQAKDDAKKARAAKKAAIAEAAELAARDTAETEAQAEMMPDIQPNFATMDEAGIKKFMVVFTRWLRNRDAVVNGPTVTAVTVKNTSLTEQTREGSTAPQANKEQETMTLYEGFFQWRYAGADMPVTIRRAHVTAVEALRDTAQEAFVRRNEA